MRMTIVSIFLCASLLAPAAALADSGQSVVAATYATYLRSHGVFEQSYVSLKPYLDPAFFALLGRWAHMSPNAKRVGEECFFDSDPLLGIQNGEGVVPVSVGAVKRYGIYDLLPVTIPIRYHPNAAPSGSAQMFATVTKIGARFRVSDIIPGIDGKPDIKYSLRSTLMKFAADPNCK